MAGREHETASVNEYTRDGSATAAQPVPVYVYCGDDATGNRLSDYPSTVQGELALRTPA